MNKQKILSNCKILLDAYKKGKLGFMQMPEDSNPGFSGEDEEFRLTYFTLPMSLNYQRDSYNLWASALKTFQDPETKIVFDLQSSANINEEQLRKYLLKYKVALQPNKHIATWQKIAKTIFKNWKSVKGLIEYADFDYLKLREIVQKQFKKELPYISGPKIFNYWCFILQEYGKVKLKNSEFIEIAPDTHVTQCSVILGVITREESELFSKEKISERWREILKGSGINPIDMHPPLWFWSRNNFQFKLNEPNN